MPPERAHLHSLARRSLAWPRDSARWHAPVRERYPTPAEQGRQAADLPEEIRERGGVPLRYDLVSRTRLFRRTGSVE
jgi:hypothetical protein